MAEKLKDILPVKKIPGIHIIADDLPGSCHPVAAVKGRPGVGLPVIRSRLHGFPGGGACPGHQIPSHHALVVDHVVPVQIRVLGRKYPVGIFRVKLAKALLVTLRKSLVGQILLKITVRLICGRKLDIVGAHVAGGLGSVFRKLDLIPHFAVAACGPSHYIDGGAVG